MLPIKTHHEVYYEFDVIMTKGRRFLDRLSAALWSFYVRSKDRPNNIYDILEHPNFTRTVPTELGRHLSDFWRRLAPSN